MKEFNIKDLVRKNILELQPYVSFRDQNRFENPVFLDANESPFGEYNRYPDSTQKELKNKLAALKNVSAQQIAVANGSDELIDLIIKIFCEPKKDSIMMMNPSFAMYKFYASINENKVVALDLDEKFQINKDLFLKVSEQEKPKVFFLCSPNNPTGNSIQDLEFYIKNCSGIIVVDEAYIEFSEQKSCIELLEKYPNLIVLQTFSKAWGMAGARVGIAYSSQEIIKLINTVKAPYNVNSLSLNKIMQLINYKNIIEENIKNTLIEISRLKDELLNVECVKRVFPTDANFFLIEFNNAENVYQELLKNEILTSKRSPQIPDCIRINVGKKEENNKLINVLKGI
ncbi:histidinol-phosphate transaminase [Chryseobacterium profundimaris]|uniref:Histidinol-phosphate aminotransferase n=1 Tax=Chryseobacterium profundimaris TaxID=1387275 RepID=A0ABY1PAI2_9FLAO|nr:histidinol-phosphate transaminase [Chryseobacterium profundimaris]SMP27951.1 histidinol-phosphate aminotransferase [Chryseobacterium profundimaris]